MDFWSKGVGCINVWFMIWGFRIKGLGLRVTVLGFKPPEGGFQGFTSPSAASLRIESTFGTSSTRIGRTQTKKAGAAGEEGVADEIASEGVARAPHRTERGGHAALHPERGPVQSAAAEAMASPSTVCFWRRQRASSPKNVGCRRADRTLNIINFIRPDCE